MDKIRTLAAMSALSIVLIACAAKAKTPLVDPFPLRFPLVEVGSLDIDGHVVGQPRARDGIVYYATREGYLTAVVARSQSVLWRFRADHTLSFGPELGDGHIIIRDDANTIDILDINGSRAFKKSLDEAASTAVREAAGRLLFGTSDGKIQAFDIKTDAGPVWEYSTTAAVTAGPVFRGDQVVFGTADGRILALDGAGHLLWDFAADGKIIVDPAVDSSRVFFGTEHRFFYCLDGATGKKRWSRRLQGAPVHPALVSRHRVTVGASNSVVYLLSRQGGSVVSWEAVPSRIIHEPVAAGRLILVSGVASRLTFLDARTGRRAGQYITAGLLAAGPVGSPPFVVLIEENQESGRQRIVALRQKG